MIETAESVVTDSNSQEEERIKDTEFQKNIERRNVRGIKNMTLNFMESYSLMPQHAARGNCCKL